MKISTPFHMIHSLLLIPVALSAAAALYSSFQCDYDSVASVDVAILGGGASGTFAAIQLHRQNRTIALVEPQDLLGGHVDTYLDQQTGKTVDYGVNQYTDIAEATELLSYLGIPYVPGTYGDQSLTYFDFNAGKILQSPNSDALSQALHTYQEQLTCYPYLEHGFYLPDPVPEDLLLPFGDFARKYKVEQTAASFAVAMGDILSLPSIYIMKHYGLHVLRNKFLFTVRKDNQEIYDKAHEVLGSSVLLSSRSQAIHRGENGDVRLCLETPTGTHLLHAKRLVMAIPLTLDNAQNTRLDLSSEETALFSNFRPVGYYIALTRIPGLKRDVLPLENVDSEDTVYHLPKLPGIWNIIATEAPDLYIVEYGSNWTMPVDEVKEQILTSIARLKSAGLVSSNEKPQIIRFSDHSPFYPYVSAEAIRDGFYRKLYGLQGKRNTFWTGSAFHVPDSSLLWRFTREAIGNLITGLE